MNIKDNPFTSDIFVRTWISCFSTVNQIRSFDFIENVLFFRSTYLPLYTCVGKNQTKGVTYQLNPHSPNDLASAVALVMDVPNYIEDSCSSAPLEIGCYKVSQYPGYLIDLTSYDGIDEYMSSQFSKSSRYKLRKYKKRLEHSFDIRYTMHTGEMPYEQYEDLFDTFRRLLGKRFDQKKTYNNNLDRREWVFYRKVAYPMICKEQAGLFVVYAGNKPIAMTLNYFSGRIVFDAITVFDTDYGKFHPGSINILALVDWCFKKGMEILDFSKGHFDYKMRWATLKYDFEYHIYFNRNSGTSSFTAQILKTFYDFKQFLRERGLTNKWHSLLYLCKNPLRRISETEKKFSYVEVSPEIIPGPCIKKDSAEYNEIIKAVFEFIYLQKEHINNIQVFRHANSQKGYLIKGESSMLGVQFK